MHSIFSQETRVKVDFKVYCSYLTFSITDCAIQFRAKMRPLPPKGRGRTGQAPPQPEVKHNFPLMPISDIIGDLALFECQLSEKDIKAPKPEIVKEVLMFFLRDLHGDNIDNKLQRQPECLETLAYPEIHEESPELLHFLRAVHEMFVDAQYFDFTLQDVYQPDSKRFRSQLCALINLAKYSRERLERYKELEVQEQEVVAQNNALADSVEKLRGAIEIIEEKRCGEQPLVDENKKIIPALAAELEQLHRRQMTLTDETGVQKAELGDLKEKARVLEMEVVRVRDEVADSQARIVSSPDRARAEIAELRRQLEREHEELTDIKRRRGAQNEQITALRTALSAIKPLIPLSESCAAIRDKKLAAQRRDAELREKEMRVQQATDAAKASAAHQERSVEAMKGRIARQIQHSEELQAQMAEDAERWRRDQSELQRFSESGELKVAALQKHMSQLVVETNLSARTFASEMEEIDKEHEMLLSGMMGHDHQLREGMAMFEADNKQAIESLQQK